MALILFLLFFGNAHATEKTYEVKSSSCKVMALKGKKWVSAPKHTVSKGMKVKGEPFEKGKVWILFRHQGKLFLGLKKCMVPSKLEALKKETPKPEPTPAATPVVESTPTPIPIAKPAPKIEEPSPWFVKIGVLALREPIVLSRASSSSVDYTATHLGICPGIGLAFEMGKHFRYSNGLCFFYSSSKLVPTLATGSTSTLSYSDRKAKAYGALFDPAFLWRSGDHAGAYGFSIPVLYRKLSAVSPPTGYSIESESQFRFGFFLKSEFQMARWVIAPEIGFFSSLKNTAAQLEIRWHFDEL